MAWTKEQRREHCQRIGRLGGLACAASHDMSERGRRGYLATCRKIGDNGQAVSLIQKWGGMPKLPRKQWSHNKEWDV